ncbi:MAG: hypothetical protein J6X52_00070, partial [Clostridia bacterium]|nr:hypothetical protein [Clostridia bacterium]
NPPMPAGISLAAGEYRARSVYRKSTKWIYIVEKGLAKASPFSGGDEGSRSRLRATPCGSRKITRGVAALLFRPLRLRDLAASATGGAQTLSSQGRL